MTEPKLRPRVERLEEDMTAVSDTLVEIRETLDEHSATLEQHTAILEQHSATLGDHGQQLVSIRATQLEQGAILDEILRRLEPR